MIEKVILDNKKYLERERLCYANQICILKYLKNMEGINDEKYRHIKNFLENKYIKN